MTVGEVSARIVVTAHPDEPIADVARRMRDEHVGDVVVADSHRRPLGMVTDRDIVVTAVAQSADKLEKLLVSDVMTRPAVTARPHETLEGGAEAHAFAWHSPASGRRSGGSTRGDLDLR